jgi:hypothetical protein
MGLYSALKWYVEGSAERSKIATNLELATDGERLPQDYELSLRGPTKFSLRLVRVGWEVYAELIASEFEGLSR